MLRDGEIDAAIYGANLPNDPSLKSVIPDGTIIGARGPHGPFAPDGALNRWFKGTYEKRYGVPPPFPAYHMVQAILGTKAAYEKAIGHATSDSTVYNLLHRQGWRKLMPRPFHPKRDLAAQNAFKKTAFLML